MGKIEELKAKSALLEMFFGLLLLLLLLQPDVFNLYDFYAFKTLLYFGM